MTDCVSLVIYKDILYSFIMEFFFITEIIIINNQTKNINIIISWNIAISSLKRKYINNRINITII
jgi:hypothetical protein